MRESKVLLLNADYRPHDILTWQDAMTLLYTGKATVLSEYEDWKVSSSTITFKVPSIMVLVKYVVFRQRVKFSRINIYARDQYQCQYCGKRAGKGHELNIHDLTFDHVFPRSRGGETSWENIVTSCQKCNTKKANRTPKEAQMVLLKEPERPKRLNNIEYILSNISVPDAWRDLIIQYKYTRSNVF